MFFVSSLSVQFCGNWLGFSPTSAAFVGSAASGYFTGAFAALQEWRKVLQSQRIVAATSAANLVREAVRTQGRAPGLASVGRRLHACGVRNGIFDSTFFGLKHLLVERGGGGAVVSGAAAFGFSAGVAVTVDYAVDVVTKRRLAQPPATVLEAESVLWAAATLLRKNGLLGYRGLGSKCCEFTLSYLITGALAPTVATVVGLAIGRRACDRESSLEQPAGKEGDRGRLRRAQ